jgi:ankyrin repeat protein
MNTLIDDVLITILKFLYPWESFGLCLASKRLHEIHAKAIWYNYQLTSEILNKICNATECHKFKFSLNFNNYDDLLINSSTIGDLPLVKTAVRYNANVHAHNDDALRNASRNGHLEVVKYLISVGADIHASGDYSLYSASSSGHLEVVKYLVSVGANIHTCDDLALCHASNNGHLDVVKCLVSASANIHALKDCALYRANAEVIKYLISL